MCLGILGLNALHSQSPCLDHTYYKRAAVQFIDEKRSSRASQSIALKSVFAVGHLALSYLSGRLMAKPLGVRLNIPIVLTLSVLPDIDLLMPMLRHGGATHSIVLYSVIALPLVLFWGRQVFPYLIAIVSHPLLGDFLTRTSGMSGVQLLFPLSSRWFSMGSTAWLTVYAFVEIGLLATMLITLTVTNDMKTLTMRHHYNLLLLIPIVTAFLPIFTEFPIPVPEILIAPHIVALLLLSISVVTDCRYFLAMRLHR